MGTEILAECRKAAGKSDTGGTEVTGGAELTIDTIPASIGIDREVVSQTLLRWTQRQLRRIRQMSVKPSAQPTMVRTHHLPPPGNAAR
jgi:hypothetical protein